MKTRHLTLAALLLGGCSTGPGGSTRALSGHVDLAQVRLVGAQVIATSSSGRVFRAPISATGGFTLALPVHATYRLAFANTTSSPRRFDRFGGLTSKRVSGTTRWFSLTPGAPINLGLIARAGTSLPKGTPSGGLGTMSSGDGAESGAKDAEVEDDGAETCDQSSGADDADFESEHDALDDVDSDHDGTPDSMDASDDRPDCAGAHDDGDECKLTDDEEHADEQSGDAPCSSTNPAPPAPVPGLV